jgi:low temperature requirement protein LtrA
MPQRTEPEPGASLAGSCSGSPVTARTVDEPHRAATQLELLFDLTFVVAVVAVVTQLDHGVAERHAADVVGPFPQVFFALW